MADQKVSLLDTLGSIDRATDYLYVVDTSAGAPTKMTVNGVLGLTGAPLGMSDAQSPTNKTFDNSNAFTVRSDRLMLQDNADTTKQANFQLSGISAATTRTFTLPNRSGTLVTLNGNQTFSGIITATGAVLDQPTITNPIITTNAINEFTANTGVNIDGLVIKDALLPAGNIQPLNLVSGTGSSWAWQSWVPTLTNLSGGTLNYARYMQTGKEVSCRLKYTLAGAGVAGTVSISLPVTASSEYTGGNDPVGAANYLDTGTEGYYGTVVLTSTTAANLRTTGTGVTYATYSGALSSTNPHTWANTDVIYCWFKYEAA